MGWCIDTARINLNKIFKEVDRKYRITHPESSQQQVVIEHLGSKDLDARLKKRVTDLFPEFVYVNFVLVQASQEVADRQEWDN